jgi:hypothetical protein
MLHGLSRPAVGILLPMAGSAAQIVHETFARLDREGHLPLEHVHRDCLVLNMTSALETKPYLGHEGVGAWERDVLGVLDDWHLEILDVRQVGDDRVGILHRLHGHMRYTGLPFDFTWATAVWLREGRSFRVEGHSLDRALEALRETADDRPVPSIE